MFSLSLECVKNFIVKLKEFDTEYFNDVIIVSDGAGYKIIDVFSGNIFYLRVGDGFFIFVNEAEVKFKKNKKKKNKKIFSF